MKKMLFLTSLMILGVIVTSQTPVDTFPLYKQYGLVRILLEWVHSD